MSTVLTTFPPPPLLPPTPLVFPAFPLKFMTSSVITDSVVVDDLVLLIYIWVYH